MYIYLETAEAIKHPDLAATQSAVLQLSKGLPYQDYQFTIFMDNLFSKPKLFSLLRQLGISACGTCCKDVTKLVFGLLDNWNPPWGTLHSKIVKAYVDIQDNGRVLCSV
jgi:hypothetical protein